VGSQFQNSVRGIIVSKIVCDYFFVKQCAIELLNHGCDWGHGTNFRSFVYEGKKIFQKVVEIKSSKFSYFSILKLLTQHNLA
jgi:hypothetical protein